MSKGQTQKPYKGLVPYTEEDAQYFFGRDRERKLIIANLMASRLTLLYGASGVGKSSVLRAGVSRSLEDLAARNLAKLGTREHVGIRFSEWKDNPISGLLEQVQKSIEQVTGIVNSPDTRTASASLTESLRGWSERAEATLLITLDQFEEYFLYRPHHREERSFAQEFGRAVNTPNLPVNFLISIREDALAKLDSFRKDIPNLFENYMRLDHLDGESARAAIEEPIKQYNILNQPEKPFGIEPDLVTTVLGQVKTGQVSSRHTGKGVVSDRTSEARIETPYLQIVMTRLWDHEVEARSNMLRLETLEELGGSTKIIETHLDAAMKKLLPAERRTAARAFHYLVTPSGTKIAHKVSDLSEYTGMPTEEVRSMVEKLTLGDVRILRSVPPPADEPSGENRYEIFHDALALPILALRARYERTEKQAEAEKLGRQNLERALKGLSDSELDIAARIFTLLITSAHTRALYSLAHLAHRAKVPIDQIRKVVTHLSASDNGVLRQIDAPSSWKDTSYEISNDFFIEPILAWNKSRPVSLRGEVNVVFAGLKLSYVGTAGTVFLSAYHLFHALFLLYLLYALWPTLARADLANADGKIPVHVFGTTLLLSDEIIFLGIAFLAGQLGGLVSGFTNFFGYVRHRVLLWRYVGLYFLWPYLGGFIGLIMYVAMRAGFFGSGGALESINPFGVAALAALGGMFAPSLIAGLRRMFEMGEIKKSARCPMVAWYDPRQLARTAVDVAISSIFGRHSDYRITEALVVPTQDDDVWGDDPDRPTDEDGVHDYSSREQMWIDYVADTGDGWDSTYSVAYYAGQQELSFTGVEEKVPRGQVLVFGGDQVYPVANRKSYRERLLEPYEAALPRADPPNPHVFAVPGNHDWYDSLVSFTRLFCSRRWFGGWKTRQSRSYFALKLPHRWWLIGIDVQLDSDIDIPQVKFFKRIARRMGDGDRIILCTAEPHWIFSELYNKYDSEINENNLEFLDKKVFIRQQIAVYLSGDLHHYRRHATDGGFQKITAGGGGAFLHPTHGEDVTELADGYNLKAAFPPERESRRLTWQNLGFLFLNPRFGFLTALLYTLTCWSVMANLSRFGIRQWWQAVKVAIAVSIANPTAVFWILLVWGGFLLFTDVHSKLYRAIAGTLHGSAHVLATFFIGWFATYLGVRWLHLPFRTPLQLLLAGAIIFVLGWIVGSIVMGIYLVISLNFFGRHSNEAFSSLACPDWKHFLRLKIDSSGLTIYPIGIRKVARKWRESDENSGPRFVPNDAKATPPQLIEEPVRLQ